MPSLATVVIPWRGGCEHRDRALRWVRRRYAEYHPGWSVVLAEYVIDPWVKAAAANPVITGAPDGIVAIVDADVWCDGIGDAVDQVAAGAAWAIPHRRVYRLTEAATSQLLASDPPDLKRGGRIPEALVQRPYIGVAGGGCVVAHRDTLLSVPIDPRFVGWGQEDESWGYALATLLGGPWRGEADLMHLWHPAQPRLDRRRGSMESWKLRRRYYGARRNPHVMRELLEEARGALNPTPLHLLSQNGDGPSPRLRGRDRRRGRE